MPRSRSRRSSSRVTAQKGIAAKVSRQAADTNATVASLHFIANKVAEYGHANALTPPQGEHVTLPSELVDWVGSRKMEQGCWA